MEDNVWTGVVDLSPNLQLQYKMGLLINVVENKEIEIPIQHIVCTRSKLEKIFTTATTESLDDFYKIFNNYARAFDILAEVNENFFLAQVLAEVGTDLLSIRESLNYSCSALKSTFSYFRDRPKEADIDGRCNNHSANQINIGNKAYANRIGNGDISSGDGYHFRGGGFFQLTGRANYQKVVDTIFENSALKYKAEEFADLITETKNGLLSALSFWYDNDMKKCKHIDCCTSIINHNTNSYYKRDKYYQMIAAIQP